MSEFTPINTQEELNDIIEKRLSRERAKFSDYDELKKFQSENSTTIAGLKTKSDELLATVKGLQEQLEAKSNEANSLKLSSLKTEVAIEKGIPLEWRDRINGTDEESIRKDAESFSALIKAQNNLNLPQPNLEKAPGDVTSTAMRNVLENLNLKGE